MTKTQHDHFHFLSTSQDQSNSIKTDIHLTLLQFYNKRVQLAEEKGRAAVNDFKIGDTVLVQYTTTVGQGTQRQADNYSTQSKLFSNKPTIRTQPTRIRKYTLSLVIWMRTWPLIIHLM